MEKLLQQVQNLVLAAKKCNLDGFEIEATVDKGFNASGRQGAVETLEHHREKSIQLSVYKDQKTGSAATSDLSDAALSQILQKACTIAKYTEADPFAGLAEKELLAFDYPDLALDYPWDISPPEAIELALRCDEAARSYDKKITQTEQASVITNAHYKVYANSDDFVGNYASSMHGISISVVAQSNGSMERDFDYFYARDARQLKKPEDIAVIAAQKAIARLEARKVNTQKCPVIFEARAAKSLIGHCIAAISGGNLYRKSSFLLDCLDKKIFPEFITISQHPHILGGYGSTPFDEQGVATKEISFIEQGILKNYVLGCYSARKLGLVTTGNAGGVFNLGISTGNKSLAMLCREMGTGLLVTELMGQGINLVTGDYSRGASGFWVENGEIVHPVHETTIAANLGDMFANLVAVGNDVDARGNVQTGSILLDAMMIA